jgi:hypothetical protein
VKRNRSSETGGSDTRLQGEQIYDAADRGVRVEHWGSRTLTTEFDKRGRIQSDHNMRLFLAIALSVFGSFTARGQVSQYVPPALTGLSAVSAKTATGGTTLTVGYTVSVGSSADAPLVSLGYSGPVSLTATGVLSPGSISIPVTNSNIIGKYTLQSITLINSTSIITYNRDGTIDPFGILSTPATHSFNLSLDDFSIVAPTPVAPSITSQPASQTVVAGSPVTFTVAATGSPSYQWQVNSRNIAGATSASYQIAAAAVSDAGTYTCVVTNQAGSVSASASLTVTPAPAFVGNVVNVSVLMQVPKGGMITAGFVLGGTAPTKILVRGIGPALGGLGLTGLMPDPVLSLHHVVNGQDQVVASNAGWGGASPLTNAFLATGAFALTDRSSSDAAILVTLQPGGYSAQVSSVQGGLTLLEVYQAP